MATRQILEDLARSFSAAKGIDIAFTAVGGVEAAARVRKGAAVDLIALASGPLDTLGQEGWLAPGLRVDYARSGMAVAIRSGAPRPDLSDEAAVRQTMQAAGRIAYSTGPSGDHVLSLWKRWGMTDELASKALRAPPGIPVASLLASGEADLGLQQESELIGAAGIDILGPLPPEIQLTTLFAAAAGAGCTDIAAATEFLAWISSADAATVIRRYGMMPA